MPETWRYRGETIDGEQIGFLREFIAAHAESSRWKLSRQLCEAMGWKQANGALRDVVCRGLLLMLERAGQIELPPVSYVRHNPLANRARPEPARIDTTPIEGGLRNLPPVRRHIRGQLRSARLRPEPVLIDITPLAMTFEALGPVEIQSVRRTADEPLFNSLLEQYHYLGYEQPVGEHLKYLVWAQGRPVACLAWSSSPRHLGARDRFIGWDPAARKRNIHLIAYNTRFLILPWVAVPHLASHILGRMGARIPADWGHSYAHPIYVLETFVDPARFRGTCYRAANWIVVGCTTGRGKDDQTHRPNRPIKQVLALPLHRRFRELLSA